jgi:hypothetical protein
MTVDLPRREFAVYDGFVRKLCQSPRQNRKSTREIILVPRHQPHAALALDSQRPVAIEFDLVFLTRTLRQLRKWKTLHRFDESSRLFCMALSG